jgi:hypothetical protein
MKINVSVYCVLYQTHGRDSRDSLVVSIGSNKTFLKFDEVASSLFSKEMRWKNISKLSSGRSKSKGRSKSSGKFVKVCWRCGIEGHYKKQCRSKVEKHKGSK